MHILCLVFYYLRLVTEGGIKKKETETEKTEENHTEERKSGQGVTIKPVIIKIR